MTRSPFSNLHAAYEGLERFDSFVDEAAISRYREAVLARTAPQSALIAELLGYPARIVEIGSGNGRLLIDLAIRGSLVFGLGVDLSQSRVDFARKWSNDVRCSDKLDLRAGDALALELESGAWDAALCITGTFAYFDAVAPGSARRLLDRLHSALHPGGLLVLELYPHLAERRLLKAAGTSVRLWRELDGDDPWRFYLSTLTLDGDVLTHDKTFVHRHSAEIDEGRRERIVLYTRETIATLLTAAGFTDPTMRAGWTNLPYSGGDLLVVSAIGS